MKDLFEYHDMLSSPVESFLFDTAIIPFPVEAHWHYYVEILYVVEGCICVTCNHDVYTLNPQELIFLPPQAVHAIYTTIPQRAKYYVLKFDANRLHFSDNYLPNISAVFRNVLPTKHSPTEQLPLTFCQKDFESLNLADFFSNCTEEVQTKPYGYDSYLYASIARLLVLLFRHWRNLKFLNDSDTYKSNGEDSIHDILKYIDEHAGENLRVEKLADMCHMSYSYFARTFHKLYGQSCKEYIEFVRLSRVENLLLFTTQDLNYISNETGFSDCSHLIRVFKRKYNMTPKQYRLAHVSKN